MADEAHEQIRVDASPTACFARASAFGEYPDWTGDVKQATVLVTDAEDRGTRVEYHVAGLGRRVRYVLDYDFAEAPHAFSWVLVEGDLLRALDGRYAFASDGDGTIVDYTLRVDLAVPLPGLVKRRASGMIMGTALRDLKRVVEAEAGMTTTGPTEPTEPTGGTSPVEPVEPVEPAEPAPATGPHPHPDAVDFASAGSEERPLPAPSVLESVISELLGAVPEVRDHVLEAADALLDAAKTLIDAADRVVRQQRGDE
jgi:Polyketide cyclase / dehydrase and lipid transport